MSLVLRDALTGTQAGAGFVSIRKYGFHDTLRHDFTRTLEIANEVVNEVVELGWHIGVLGIVTHVTQGLDVEHERIKESE